jgi:hypothetical protein
VDAGLGEVVALFWDQGLEDAVLGTHGETIGRLLGQLVADGLVGAAPLDWPKGSTWLLQRASQPRVRAAFWPRWPLAVAWKSASAPPPRRATGAREGKSSDALGHVWGMNQGTPRDNSGFTRAVVIWH